MQEKNVLLICGGGGTEHSISLKSASFILSKLELLKNVTPHYLCIEEGGQRTNLLGQSCELRKAGEIYNRETEEIVKLDYAIACIHGPPGENGQLQSVFELMGLPYLGANPEASLNCFNKVTNKLWLSSAAIPNSPYIYLVDKSEDSIDKAKAFFRENNDSPVFVKAASQGSSIGCYKCTQEEDIESSIKEAFKYSNYVLVETGIRGRELEVAVFEKSGEVIATVPGEITCPAEFYDYEEKYNKESQTVTHIEAPGIAPEIVKRMKSIAIQAFELFKIKDLARVDFFLTEANEIFLNEVNTFPGHTEISMFPSMMENTGYKYEEFLNERIKTALGN